MLTKCAFTINDITYDIPDDCICNWDEIKCVYKRSGYGGVIRSFASKFEFTGEAYDMLYDLFLQDGVNAICLISLYTITNKWEWRLEFSSTIDFSTLTLSNGTLSVNCIDNSLNAILKSKKGIKFDIEIGKDIVTDATIEYDRVHLCESATYEFTEGESKDDGSIAVRFFNDQLPTVGIIGEPELTSAASFRCVEDQTNNGDRFILEALKDSSIEIVWDFRISIAMGYAGTTIAFEVVENDGQRIVSSKTVPLKRGDTEVSNVYEYNQLPDPNSVGFTYCLVNGALYKREAILQINPDGTTTPAYYHWKYIGSNLEYTATSTGHHTFSMRQGQKVRVRAIIENTTSAEIVFLTQSMTFNWQSIGKKVNLHAIKPLTLINTLCTKIADKCAVGISTHDERLAGTFIIPGESLRSLPHAKITTSFDDFCKWMESVFGYVYKTEDILVQPKYTTRNTFAGIKMLPSTIIGQPPVAINYDKLEEPVPVEQIYFVPDKRLFCAFTQGDIFAKWEGSEVYNTESGSDEFTIITAKSGQIYTNLYDNKDYTVSGNTLVPYEYNPDDWNTHYRHTIDFMHISELYDVDTHAITLTDAKDVSLGIDKNTLCSSVEIGYSKQDYESKSGRDEWNFTNTYETGICNTDKKLSYISPYRADCYGFEYAVSKRDDTNKDNGSDSDIFFILCKRKNATSGIWIPDRDYPLSGVLSSLVFNVRYAPYFNLQALSPIIGACHNPLALHLTTTEGNDKVVLLDNGICLASDITIESSMFTAVTVSFNTYHKPQALDFSRLYEITYRGKKYTGFLTEVSIKYAREEQYKYSLIVKSISQC